MCWCVCRFLQGNPLERVYTAAFAGLDSLQNMWGMELSSRVTCYVWACLVRMLLGSVLFSMLLLLLLCIVYLWCSCANECFWVEWSLWSLHGVLWFSCVNFLIFFFNYISNSILVIHMYHMHITCQFELCWWHIWGLRVVFAVFLCQLTLVWINVGFAWCTHIHTYVPTYVYMYVHRCVVC